MPKKKTIGPVGSEADIRKLLKGSANDLPSGETLDLMFHQLVLEGKLDPEKLESRSAAFYLWFLADREGKSPLQIAADLGVSRADLAIFSRELRFIRDEDLFELCKEFCAKHPKFQLDRLLTILRKAISLYAMTTGASVIRKAARKKPSKR
jgi:hypothetical protein